MKILIALVGIYVVVTFLLTILYVLLEDPAIDQTEGQHLVEAAKWAAAWPKKLAVTVWVHGKAFWLWIKS
tara:strand:- start:110 stop:319 length:210 start_codon:yes stop_codon:yes gene_type:complete